MPRVRTWQLASTRQSFQQDKHEDKRSGIWIIREEEKKNPTCNASASTSEGEGDRHPAVRTRAEKRQLERRWKTKDASTTRCVHINAASPASNLDTLTLSQYKGQKLAENTRRTSRFDQWQSWLVARTLLLPPQPPVTNATVLSKQALRLSEKNISPAHSNTKQAFNRWENIWMAGW